MRCSKQLRFLAGSAFLHGSWYETGGTSTPPLGVSPAGSGAPMSWTPHTDAAALLHARHHSLLHAITTHE